MNIFERKSKLVILIELHSLGLSIIFSVSSFEKLLIPFVPDSTSLMILLADMHWWNLANKIFGSHDSKNDLILEVFFLSHLELNLFSNKILWVVLLPVGLFADRYHRLDIVEVSRRLILDHWGPKSGRPNVERRIHF